MILEWLDMEPPRHDQERGKCFLLQSSALPLPARLDLGTEEENNALPEKSHN
jgi:hypothetical protein